MSAGASRGPMDETGQLPRRRRSLPHRTPGFTSGTGPQVTLALSSAPRLPGPVLVSRPGFGSGVGVPVPQRPGMGSWGRDRNPGQGRVGARWVGGWVAGGLPARSRREEEGEAGSLSLLASWNCPGSGSGAPRLSAETPAFLEGEGKV